MNIKYFLLFFLLISFIFFSLLTKNYYRKEKFSNRIKEISKDKIDLNSKIINFPKYYINLDISKNRNNEIIEHFKEYQINNYYRINAFDGNKIKNLNQGEINNYKYNNNSKNCTKKELAITMSHLIAMKKAKDDGHQKAIIMEDDCRFNLVPYWKKSFEELTKEIPEDCEIFLLANRKYKKGDWKIIKVKDYSDFVGVCYIITKKGLDKLDKFIKDKNINLKSDNIIFDQGFMGSFNVYTYDTPLLLLDNFRFNSTHKLDLFGLQKESKIVLENFNQLFNVT